MNKKQRRTMMTDVSLLDINKCMLIAVSSIEKRKRELLALYYILWHQYITLCVILLIKVFLITAHRKHLKAYLDAFKEG